MKTWILSKYGARVENDLYISQLWDDNKATNVPS